MPVFVLFFNIVEEDEYVQFRRSHESRTRTLLLMLYHEKLTEFQNFWTLLQYREVSFALLYHCLFSFSLVSPDNVTTL
jgi:hypothetical protein